MAALLDAKRIPSRPIFVDSSIANRATGVFARYMLLRVLVLVGILAPLALSALALLLVPAVFISALATLWYLGVARQSPDKPPQEVAVRNPFDIMPALALMALVMVLSLASRWVLHRFGDADLAAVLALSGMVDVDSAIITMGGLPHGTLNGQTADLILAVPIMLNILAKAGVASGDQSRASGLK